MEFLKDWCAIELQGTLDNRSEDSFAEALLALWILITMKQILRDLQTTEKGKVIIIRFQYWEL